MKWYHYVVNILALTPLYSLQAADALRNKPLPPIPKKPIAISISEAEHGQTESDNRILRSEGYKSEGDEPYETSPADALTEEQREYLEVLRNPKPGEKIKHQLQAARLRQAEKGLSPFWRAAITPGILVQKASRKVAGAVNPDNWGSKKEKNKERDRAHTN